MLLLVFVGAGGAFALWKKGLLGGPSAEGGPEAAGSPKAAAGSRTAPKPTPATGPDPALPGSAGKPGSEKPGGGTTEPAKGGPRRVDARDVERADRVYAAAEDHFGAGRFKEAVDALDGVLSGSPALDEPREKKLREFRKRAFQHHVVGQDFKLDSRLEGDTTLLRMVDGREIEVRITHQTDDRVDVVWKGISHSFRKAEILEQRLIPRAELAERDRTAYEKNLGEAAGGGPRAYLAVIKFCVERDLRAKIPLLVQRALQERPTFFEELFEAKAALLYQRSLAFAHARQEEKKKEIHDRILRDYQETAVAQELQGLARRPGKPPADPEEEQQVAKRLEEKWAGPKTTSSSAEARTLLTQADEAYAQAMKEYRLSFPGQPDADKHLKTAFGMFKKALEIYTKAFEADPKNSRIEEKIGVCNREIYSCQKQMKIN